MKKDYTGHSFKVSEYSAIYKITGRTDEVYIIEFDNGRSFQHGILHTNRQIHEGVYVLLSNPRYELRKRLKNEIV